ncbi:GroES [Achromobacter phage Motura]|uniref:GroES n=1 Tax=Achromobacter phage Motura TaxID=2591403 RepID=A0A514CSH9_9CAUD|nr:GroES [Achromobacter phage Motura]QDH83429.1 GroES [Achromobacter phage Motura]
MQPFHDFVLIKIIDTTTKSAGGLYIAQQSRSPYKRGEVVNLGPGAVNFNGVTIPMQSQIGDEVVFSSDVETFTENGEEYTLIKDAFILAKV